MASASQVVTYKCAVCGTLKGETNHWLILVVNTDPEFGRTLHLRPFLSGAFDRQLIDDDQAICGDVCAGKALQKYLSELRKLSELTVLRVNAPVEVSG